MTFNQSRCRDANSRHFKAPGLSRLTIHSPSTNLDTASLPSVTPGVANGELPVPVAVVEQLDEATESRPSRACALSNKSEVWIGFIGIKIPILLLVRSKCELQRIDPADCFAYTVEITSLSWSGRGSEVATSGKRNVSSGFCVLVLASQVAGQSSLREIIVIIDESICGRDRQVSHIQ